MNSDVAAVTEILTAWFNELTPGEVEREVGTRISSIETSLEFVVAEDGGEVAGVAGLAAVEEVGAVEAVCVYVRKEAVGRGIGRALIERLETDAAALGFATLLIVSGSRYREIGYPFWTRRYGEPAIDADYWGPGFERAVWRHRLAAAQN
jgi:N-acetylglutamate synthase-like GNAT family acetyltransferase